MSTVLPYNAMEVSDKHESDPNKEQRRTLTVSFGPGGSPSSSTTMLATKSDPNHPNPPIKRRRTQITELNLTWWDMFLGLFIGPKRMSRKVQATVQFAVEEDSTDQIFDHRRYPFIVDVYAFSFGSFELEHCQAVRCTFDTGCLQGNIISRTTANRLGFHRFESLDSSEERDGHGITGHPHSVIGAIHLTWYTSTSPKMFTKMRFLVSESEAFELVVGAASIIRHNIISPPNFGVTDFDAKQERERQRLTKKIEDAKSDVEDAKRRKDDTQTINALEKDLTDAEKELQDFEEAERKRLEEESKNKKGKGKQGKKTKAKTA